MLCLQHDGKKVGGGGEADPFSLKFVAGLQAVATDLGPRNTSCCVLDTTIRKKKKAYRFSLKLVVRLRAVTTGLGPRNTSCCVLNTTIRKRKTKKEEKSLPFQPGTFVWPRSWAP